MSIKGLAEKISLGETCLAAAGTSRYRVFSFETPLKGIPAATVLLSWPEGAFGDMKALRAFMCTDLDLSPQEIVGLYGNRWKIETLFRGAVTKLGLDSHMLRSPKAIKRLWILTCLAHNQCTGIGPQAIPFGDGLRKAMLELEISKARAAHRLGREGVSFASLEQDIRSRLHSA
jgi:hypothetical protein